MATLKLFGFACTLVVALLAERSLCELNPQLLELLLASPLEVLSQTVVPLLAGQQPNNVNGTEFWFKEYALNDESNEDIGQLTTQELILRAGFAYKNHYVVSRDGYITQLIHLINPLALTEWLKEPPIMLTHGGLINPSIYVCSSNIQHHPEPWPRVAEDGPITSWNRSLAFTLANNGYDVWLVGTRGASRQNQGHTKFRVFEPKGRGSNSEFTPVNITLAELEDTFKYWNFGFDELIEFELAAQIDRVLQLTGAKKVSFFSFSLSCMSGLPFFASHPDYARRIHQHIVMAPPISNRGVNTIVRSVQAFITATGYYPGTTLANLFLLTQPSRDFTIFINSNRALRYTLVKGITTIVLGASPKYHSNLDSGALGHVLEQVAFKEIKHYCQQLFANRFQKFDYDPSTNFIKYGSFFPPAYNITNQHIDNWMLVELTNDNLAGPKSSQQIYETISPKPEVRIVVPFSNHLDGIVAFTNDIHVNLPILDYLDRFQLPRRFRPARTIREQESLDAVDRHLAKFVPGVHAGDTNGVPEAL